eukprot:675421-Ditylum_brightwellii.AAC.1
MGHIVCRSHEIICHSWERYPQEWEIEKGPHIVVCHNDRPSNRLVQITGIKTKRADVLSNVVETIWLT